MSDPSATRNTSTRSYGAYGERRHAIDVARTAYAGQRAEPDTGWYLLGGRLFSPLLRRFLAPDPLSPFDAGGINRHAYCSGDPVNHVDPSGNMPLPWKRPSPAPKAAPTMRAATARDAPGTSQTPAMAATTSAAANNVAGLPAAVPSGSRRPPVVPGATVLGSLAGGENSTSGNVATVPAKKRRIATSEPTGAATTPQAQDERTIKILSGAGIPKRMWADTAAGKELHQQWRFGRPKNMPGTEIWVTETLTGAGEALSIVKRLKERGSTQVTFYSGTEGSLTGANWDPQTGRRLQSDPARYAFNTSVLRSFPNLGISITSLDLGQFTRDEIKTRLSQRGAHVLLFNYSAADTLLMDTLGLREVTLYVGRTMNT